MTNDELNGWYKEEILKECLHKYKRVSIKGYLYRECTKCDYRSQVHGLIDLELMQPRDHLSDPAVILRAMQKLINAGYIFEPLYMGGEIVPDNIWIIFPKTMFPRQSPAHICGLTNKAIMLALKAKVENDTRRTD